MAKDTIMTVSIMIPPANRSTIPMGKAFVIGRIPVRYMHHVNGGLSTPCRSESRQAG
jgi:hypothetical protein